MMDIGAMQLTVTHLLFNWRQRGAEEVHLTQFPVLIGIFFTNIHRLDRCCDRFQKRVRTNRLCSSLTMSAQIPERQQTVADQTAPS
jgi:hypothetical protein